MRSLSERARAASEAAHARRQVDSVDWNSECPEKTAHHRLAEHLAISLGGIFAEEVFDAKLVTMTRLSVRSQQLLSRSVEQNILRVEACGFGNEVSCIVVQVIFRIGPEASELQALAALCRRLEPTVDILCLIELRITWRTCCQGFVGNLGNRELDEMRHRNTQSPARICDSSLVLDAHYAGSSWWSDCRATLGRYCLHCRRGTHQNAAHQCDCAHAF